MKILMLLFKDIHYDARVQREALALAEAGHMIYLACLEEYTTSPPELHPSIIIFRSTIVTKRMRRAVMNQNDSKSSSLQKMAFKMVRNPVLKLFKDIMANREYYFKVKDYIKDENITCIHCHDLNTLPVGYFMAKGLGVKLVYDSHELFNEMAGKNPVEKRVGYWIEKRLIKHIDHLITVNPYTEKEFHKRYGMIPSTIVQNTPILPGEDQLKVVENNYWRQKFNLSHEDIILLYQGGMTPERGIEECISALLLLPSRFKLILLGEGRLKEKLIQMVKDLNLLDRVFFHQQVPPDDILWYTKQADLGLVIYKNTCQNNYLSTPNKIFEYMMAGIPTLASNHPGKSYLVEKEKTGICVEENPQSIKDGIERIMSNYREYQTNCIEKRSAFSWQAEQNKIVGLYQSLGR